MQNSENFMCHINWGGGLSAVANEFRELVMRKIDY